MQLSPISNLNPNFKTYKTKQIAKADKSKIYVILDDCALSGLSMAEDVQIFNIVMNGKSSDVDFVFCSVLKTKLAKELAQKLASKSHFAYIPMDVCKTYNISENNDAMLNDGFSEEEIAVLKKTVKTGFADDNFAANKATLYQIKNPIDYDF